MLGIENIAARMLHASAVIWFLTAVVGQWLFVYYIAGFYGPATLVGDFESWRRNEGLIDGYVAGDVTGNFFFATHVLIAAVLTFGATLQLIPQIRARAMAFHRWNGRVLLLAAIGAASAGLYLQWVRGTALHSRDTGIVEAFGTAFDGVLILLFAGLAWRAVRAKRTAAHQRWATRLFLVLNGVWFMRVGISAWMLLTPFSPASFFTFWSFGAYLVPLAAYEIYLRAQKAAVPAQLIVAAASHSINEKAHDVYETSARSGARRRSSLPDHHGMCAVRLHARSGSGDFSGGHGTNGEQSRCS